MKKQYKSSIIRNHKITNKRNFDGVSLTLSQTTPDFYVFAVKVFLKTQREKEKLLVMSNFPLSHSVFYPSGELSVISIKFEIVICNVFQFGSV